MAASEDRTLFDPVKVGTTRYRYRAQPSPLPGRPRDENTHNPSQDLLRARCLANRYAGFGKRSEESGRPKAETAPRADFSSRCPARGKVADDQDCELRSDPQGRSLVCPRRLGAKMTIAIPGALG